MREVSERDKGGGRRVAAGLRDALALYAMVNQGWPSLAMPQDVRSDKQMAHQVVRYQQACIELAGSERLRTMHQRWASLFPGS